MTLHAVVEPLNEETCRSVVNEALGTSPLTRTAGLAFLLAQCEDGILWGALRGGRWVTSHDALPEHAVELRIPTLMELRLFGNDREIFLWRKGSSFCGRVLGDPDTSANRALTPIDRAVVLIGDRFVAANEALSFSTVADATGSRHVVPLLCREGDFTGFRLPLRMRVRHYLETVDRTGEVRIAASRLASVWKQ